MKNKNFLKNKIFVSILTLFIIFPCFIPVFAESVDVTYVKVGYLENYGVIKSPYVKDFEGYGYEYFQKIEDYSNLRFEFIECTWSDVFDRLRTGEIDILAPVIENSDFADEFIYSKSEFGKDSLFLTSSDKYMLDSNSFYYLNDKKIAVANNSGFYSTLIDFLDEYNVYPEIQFANISSYSKEIDRGYFDYILTGSLQMEKNLNVSLNLGVFPSYFLGNEHSQDIIDEIDLAINKINTNEYLFQEHLYLKYFDQKIDANQYISSYEFDLMQSDSYTVGVVNMYPFFGYKDVSKINNVSYDVMLFIADLLEIEVDFVEISSKTTQKELDALDFYFPLNGLNVDPDIIRQSNVYSTYNRILISNESSSEKLGVLDYYGFSDEYLEQFTNISDVIYFSELSELLLAFEKFEISSLILSDSVYSLLYSIFNIEHHVLELDYPTSSRIFYSNHFPIEKIEIIDKALSYLAPKDLDLILTDNMNLMRDMEQWYTYRSYIYVISSIIFTFIVIIFVFKTLKSRQMMKLVTFDELTGLITQKKFIEETRDILDANTDKNFTIVTFDVDNFKYINELYGYEKGNQVLKIIANHSKATLDKSSPFSRLSRDHFVMLIETKQHSDLLTADDIIAKLLHEELKDVIDRSYSVSFSVGVYDIADPCVDISIMIDYANLARTYSKLKTGNYYTCFTEDMIIKERIKLDITSNMYPALENREFVLFYQPKFDMSTMQIIGAEALVRWFRDGKIVPPNDFIPLFEKNGFIENLDYYVIDTACSFIKNNKNTPLISINLSGITLMKKDVVEKILGIIQKYELPANCIELEITESAFVDDFESTNAKVDSLRNIGFKVSMDDFGSGISSLGRLKDMSIDILKIDRAFLIDALENQKSDIILESVIDLSQKLKLETIAEGIETQEQLDFLRKIGCNMGQGYFFSRPLPESDFLEKLQN